MHRILASNLEVTTVMAARIAHRLSPIFVLLSLLFALSPSATHAQTRDWAVSYDGGFGDFPACCPAYFYNTIGGSAKDSLAADAAGNVYIAGTSWNGVNADFVTAKYSPAGALLWAVRYDGGTDDRAGALAVDGAGNVYVTGAFWADSWYGVQPQTRTVKYGPGGNLLWAVTYVTGIASYSLAVTTDAGGNAYVAIHGYSQDDFLFAELVKYGPGGNELWNNYPPHFHSDHYEDKQPVDVDVDAAGNVYLTGWVERQSGPELDYFVARFSGSGSLLWGERYDSGSGDIALDAAVDASGNVYVTGNSGTVKYSAAGVFQWAAPFAGTATAVIAAGGAVYATGGMTVRYDAATGAPSWSAVYDGGADDLRLVGGTLYVTGTSRRVAGADVLTLGYAPETGAVVWSDSYDGGGNDRAYAIASNGSGSFWVGGVSGNGTDDDLLVLRYSTPAGVALKDLVLSPATFPGGCGSSTGKVILAGPAPAGGAVVALASTNPVAVLPPSVTVPAGATSATFPITAPAVSAVQTGTVTASYGGVQSSETLKVRPIGVSSLTLSPNPVVGGQGVAGSLVLECPAAPGAVVVNLSSSNPAVVWPGAASVTVPAGAVTARFTVLTADVAVESYADIRATAGGVTKRVRLVVQP
jgi:hypothetical protein